MTPAALRQAERAKVLRKIQQLSRAAALDQHRRTAMQKDGYLEALGDLHAAVKRMR